MSDAVLPGLCFRPWISLPVGLCSMSTAFAELVCSLLRCLPVMAIIADSATIVWTDCIRMERTVERSLYEYGTVNLLLTATVQVDITAY